MKGDEEEVTSVFFFNHSEVSLSESLEAYTHTVYTRKHTRTCAHTHSL